MKGRVNGERRRSFTCSKRGGEKGTGEVPSGTFHGYPTHTHTYHGARALTEASVDNGSPAQKGSSPSPKNAPNPHEKCRESPSRPRSAAPCFFLSPTHPLSHSLTFPPCVFFPTTTTTKALREILATTQPAYVWVLIHTLEEKKRRRGKRKKKRKNGSSLLTSREEGKQRSSWIVNTHIRTQRRGRGRWGERGFG